jgi:N-acetylglucosamine kinase-like BadF-type ATPase
MNRPLVLAIDGGNWKTDLALVRGDGEVLALVRGPQSSPHHLGLEGSLTVMSDLLAQAIEEAGLPNGDGSVAEVGQLLLAGVDFPSEVEEMRAAASSRRLASRISVGNDTFAVLRAGTEQGWGVGVVCGAGINCVGVAPDGRQARFPALGWITGDWGGGYDVGVEAVSAAARSEDGRGRRTTLEQAVPAHFGQPTPSGLAEEFHRGRIVQRRVVELAPVVFAEAARDAVAAEIVDRLAQEVVTMVRVTLERLDLRGEAGVKDTAPAAKVRVTSSPPIVGAALLGLDELGAGEEAQQRLRRELAEVFPGIENPYGDGRKRPGRSRR